MTAAQRIPDEAVEAAAKAIEQRLRLYPTTELSGAVGWGATTDELAGLALAAAVPFLREQWKRQQVAVERCWESGHRVRMRNSEWFCWDCERVARSEAAGQ